MWDTCGAPPPCPLKPWVQDEAFALWQLEWGALYDEGTPSRQVAACRGGNAGGAVHMEGHVRLLVG